MQACQGLEPPSRASLEAALKALPARRTLIVTGACLRAQGLEVRSCHVQPCHQRHLKDPTLGVGPHVSRHYGTASEIKRIHHTGQELVFSHDPEAECPISC